MNISVIIPNHNGQHLLKKNLPKVLEEFKKYNLGKVEIIFIDDASTDNSLKILSDFQKKFFA